MFKEMFIVAGKDLAVLHFEAIMFGAALHVQRFLFRSLLNLSY